MIGVGLLFKLISCLFSWMGVDAYYTLGRSDYAVTAIVRAQRLKSISASIVYWILYSYLNSGMLLSCNNAILME